MFLSHSPIHPLLSHALPLLHLTWTITARASYTVVPSFSTTSNATSFFNIKDKNKCLTFLFNGFYARKKGSAISQCYCGHHKQKQNRLQLRPYLQLPSPRPGCIPTPISTSACSSGKHNLSLLRSSFCTRDTWIHHSQLQHVVMAVMDYATRKISSGESTPSILLKFGRLAGKYKHNGQALLTSALLIKTLAVTEISQRLARLFRQSVVFSLWFARHQEIDHKWQLSTLIKPHTHSYRQKQVTKLSRRKYRLCPNV